MHVDVRHLLKLALGIVGTLAIASQSLVMAQDSAERRVEVRVERENGRGHDRAPDRDRRTRSSS